MQEKNIIPKWMKVKDIIEFYRDFYKDFDNEEIAKLLGLSKRTVETHLNKAYKKLRIDLKEIRFYLFYLSLLFH